MIALWLPFMMALVLTSVHQLPVFVDGMLTLFELVVLVWLLLRMKASSFVEFAHEAIHVRRGQKLVSKVPLDDIERVVVAGHTFSVCRHGRSLSLVMRAIRVKEKREQQQYVQEIENWARIHHIHSQK